MRQSWEDKPDGCENTELIAAPASAGVIVEARANPKWYAKH
jgi:hypothetical protein